MMTGITRSRIDVGKCGCSNARAPITFRRGNERNGYDMRQFALELDDGTLFGNDAGEDEPADILASYFVDQEAFRPFFRSETKYCVARSKKGMGKSALLSKFAYDLSGSAGRNDIVIRVIGSQITAGSIPTFSGFLDAQAFWVRAICSKINSCIGSEIGFAFSDTQMSLVEAAEISGLKSRNLVGALLSRIKSSRIPIEVTAPGAVNPAALLDRALKTDADRFVWLLVDDIDASFENTAQQQLAIGSFFSACRYVATNFKGVGIRCTVRADVWANLRSVEDLDKSEQYIIDIFWTKDELKSILSKKILAWIERNWPGHRLTEVNYVRDADKLIELAFERRIRWGSHKVPPFQPVSILAGGRPRWMSQLCRMAGVKATIRGKLISNVEISSVMHEFTRYRLNDLYKEHHHQFSKLEGLASIFSGSLTKFTTDELARKINREFVGPVGVTNIPAIDGEAYKSLLQLASLLFQVGFLVARKGDERDARAADFITHSERPELLKHGIPTEEDLHWEIYPSYRQRPRQKPRRIGA